MADQTLTGSFKAEIPTDFNEFIEEILLFH